MDFFVCFFSDFALFLREVVEGIDIDYVVVIVAVCEFAFIVTYANVEIVWVYLVDIGFYCWLFVE